VEGYFRVTLIDTVISFSLPAPGAIVGSESEGNRYFAGHCRSTSKFESKPPAKNRFLSRF